MVYTILVILVLYIAVYLFEEYQRLYNNEVQRSVDQMKQAVKSRSTRTEI